MIIKYKYAHTYTQHMRNILRCPAPAVVGCDTWLGAAAVGSPRLVRLRSNCTDDQQIPTAAQQRQQQRAQVTTTIKLLNSREHLPYDQSRTLIHSLQESWL